MTTPLVTMRQNKRYYVVGEQLRDYRERVLGCSQRHLAMLLGVSATYAGQIERDGEHSLSEETAAKLTQILECKQ